MKKLVTIIWLLTLTYPLFASLESLDSYTNFKIKPQELWICTSIAFPVDISYDAFNVDFKSIVQGGHGYFVQVLPGVHTDGNSMPDASAVIKDHASGVLNVAGKPAGVYEYVFITTDDNGFCGMSKDEQTVVRVYLVPQLTGFPVLTNVCPGETASVNFNDFIPPEIKYFIDEMGWTISWFRNETPVTTMPFEAGLSNVGNTTYKYTINDNSGEYKGKYAELKDKKVYACPQDTALLTHTVRIREGGEYAIPNKSISFCTDALSLVSETWPIFTTNLFGYLGSSMPNGKWSLSRPDPGYVRPDEISIEENGKVIINPDQLKTVLNIDSIVFKYTYKDCMAKDTFTLLSFNFKKDFTKTFVDGKTQDICRNLMSGVVELSSIFGFTVPLTSGIWYEKNGDDLNELLYGAADISEMKAGSIYSFQYDVNAAVDSLCLVQGTSTLFKLRMLDFETSNAEIKICKSQFASGVTVDLSRYIPGLSNVGDLKSTVIWRDNNGTEIPNPANYTLKATEESQTQEEANFRMRYSYELKSDCGPYSGNLYISTVDDIGTDTERKIVICYTDNYASHVDLFQVMGIAGAGGHFVLCSEQSLPPDVTTSIEESGIVNMSSLFNPENDRETYKFCYLPGQSDTCMKDKNMEITVVVTKNVENSSEFKKKVE